MDEESVWVVDSDNEVVGVIVAVPAPLTVGSTLQLAETESQRERV